MDFINNIFQVDAGLTVCLSACWQEFKSPWQVFVHRGSLEFALFHKMEIIGPVKRI